MAWRRGREPSLDPGRPRIFNIGLNKTGTSSFDAAMTILGFHSLHGGEGAGHDDVMRAVHAGEPLLRYVDPVYDAFSDIGVLSRRFKMLDRQYPDSRFVCTVRPVDEWLDSRRRHVEHNQRRKAAGEYDGTFLVVDIDKWRGEWDRHLTDVRAYFEGRDDFVEIDLTATPSWEPFCRLLDRPVPDVAFPWANREYTSNGPSERTAAT